MNANWGDMTELERELHIASKRDKAESWQGVRNRIAREQEDRIAALTAQRDKLLAACSHCRSGGKGDNEPPCASRRG